jgi:nucleoside-diphosphate-sugar epimerase
MKIGITGASGFVGRALVRRFAGGHRLRCLRRESSDMTPLVNCEDQIDWITGGLTEPESLTELVQGCDAVVHAAYWRPGQGFRGTEGDVVEFARINILGTLTLIEAAISAGVQRFVFVSTCATHEKILDDRPLDETHPLWPLTHYGAHKAALEKFVHSYGLGAGYPICAIRPTGIYGLQYPVKRSKWFPLVRDIVAGKDVRVQGGGKEVQVDDVARGIDILLQAPSNAIAGEAFACYDRYISEYEVASIAKRLAGSASQIVGEPKTPKHQIVTEKIRRLGMEFGGTALLEKTIGQLVDAAGS